MLFTVTDSIRAQRNAWLIEDEFLKKNYGAFPALRAAALQDNEQPAPFIFSNYNVSTFTANDRSVRSIFARILNCLIDSLNKYHLLPRFIVMIPEWDILKHLNYYEFGISKMIGAGIEWLIDEISNLITDKKEQMRLVRPGAVTSLEPKVIWLKIISRPYNPKIMLQREKFNAILEETLFKTKKMYIMDVQEEANLSFTHDFELNGELNKYGKAKFWKEFDRQLGKLDRQQIRLKPQAIISESANKSKE